MTNERNYHISITATLNNKIVGEAQIANLTKEEATLDHPHIPYFVFTLQNEHPKAMITVW